MGFFMALTISEQEYLEALYVARTKRISGTWVVSHDVGGKDRQFAVPPSLQYINTEISRLEAKRDYAYGCINKVRFDAPT